MMKKFPTNNLRIKTFKTIPSPALICEEIPVTEQAAELTYQTRQEIHNILYGKDDRLLVITGPCSIHDVKAAKEYALRLKEWVEEYRDSLLIVMRVYFEKPRTILGWKGLINDPNLDGSFKINKGLQTARQLLLDINQLGVSAGTEFLDLITPQYIADLIGWGAIGARTTESQVHRELASGLSCPVGFKNGTDGNIKIAVDAIRAASCSHHFLALKMEGQGAIFETKGNPDCHLILRGGRQPNYDKKTVSETAEELINVGLQGRVMIDFSHANSEKQYQKQMEVGMDVAARIKSDNQQIFGVMIESNLVAGRQNLQTDKALVYGQSITDPCLGWEETEHVLAQLYGASKKRMELAKSQGKHN